MASLSDRERRGWRHRARSAFSERLGLKATSLFVATLLWLVVGAREPTEATVLVHVVPQIEGSRVLADSVPQVRALVSGRAADVVKLYTAPPVVRRVVPRGAPDTLTLELSPADVRLPADLGEQVHVLEVAPRTVTLHLGRAR